MEKVSKSLCFFYRQAFNLFKVAEQLFIYVKSKFGVISLFSLNIVQQETVWTAILDFVNNLIRAKE